jgi:hypothetical protein
MLHYGEVMAENHPSSPDEPLELAGSWTIPLRRLGLANRTVMGWPFGKLSLTDNEMVLSGRGPFWFIREVIPLEDIVHIERQRGWIIPNTTRQLRFRTRSSRFDRTLFASTLRRVQLLEERLEKLGLSVERG